MGSIGDRGVLGSTQQGYGELETRGRTPCAVKALTPRRFEACASWASITRSA